ncbi:MAG TPA: hypothetical protein VHB46_19145 [Burkholderiales bacterium]|nr:hypothetical protein [Burkholderiales bacterium]
MKRCWLWTIPMIMAIAPAARAQDVPDIATFAFDDVTCTAWARSASDKLLRTQYGIWFRGFVSGYNFGNPGNQVLLGKLPDPPALASSVDKFCRDNPSASFVEAIIPMVRELRQVKAPVPERKP